MRSIEIRELLIYTSYINIIVSTVCVCGFCVKKKNDALRAAVLFCEVFQCYSTVVFQIPIPGYLFVFWGNFGVPFG